jgi:hypothetical protein
MVRSFLPGSVVFDASMRSAPMHLRIGSERLRAAFCAFLLASGFLQSGCGPGAAGATAVPSAASGLPPYRPDDAVLFDDNFATEVFGFFTTGRNDDATKFAERIKGAEAVVRARVSTVTRDRSATGSESFQLVFQAVAPALAGSDPTEPIAVSLTSGSPSYPLLAADETVLVGRVVVFFFRRYNEHGSIAVHWHAEVDGEKTLSKIKPSRPGEAGGHQ